MAQKLVSIFPFQTTEDIFFTPSQNNRDPAGKLYNAYITIRARMAKAGLIFRKFQKGRSRPIEINDEQNEKVTMSRDNIQQLEQKPTITTINLLDDEDDFSLMSNCSTTSSLSQQKHKMFL